MARARDFAGILLGTERAPRADEEIDRTKADGNYVLTDKDRKEKMRLRQANGNAYINLQFSCEELPYDLVSLAKTEELPDGCTRDAWEKLTSEYDLTEGKDKITLLTMFQQNQLDDVRTNITVWLPSLALQVNKLKKLNHVLDEEYQITHILASVRREYSSVVEQVKIDIRTNQALIIMDEVKKADYWDLKNKKKIAKKVRERSRMINHTSDVSFVKRWVIMPMNAEVGKVQVGVTHMTPLQ